MLARLVDASRYGAIASAAGGAALRDNAALLDRARGCTLALLGRTAIRARASRRRRSRRWSSDWSRSATPPCI